MASSSPSSSSERNQQQAAATPSSAASDSVQSNSWERVERKFSNKSASEYFDPCQDFADRSLKCMKRNAFDREMCHDYFQAYRDCKKQWLTQKKRGA